MAALCFLSLLRRDHPPCSQARRRTARDLIAPERKSSTDLCQSLKLLERVRPWDDDDDREGPSPPFPLLSFPSLLFPHTADSSRGERRAEEPQRVKRSEVIYEMTT
jgi:hypothetical protein